MGNPLKPFDFGRDDAAAAPAKRPVAKPARTRTDAEAVTGTGTAWTTGAKAVAKGKKVKVRARKKQAKKPHSSRPGTAPAANAVRRAPSAAGDTAVLTVAAKEQRQQTRARSHAAVHARLRQARWTLVDAPRAAPAVPQTHTSAHAPTRTPHSRDPPPHRAVAVAV